MHKVLQTAVENKLDQGSKKESTDSKQATATTTTPTTTTATATDQSVIERCLAHNKNVYHTSYDKSIYDYRAPPSEHLAIITCMDARIDPLRMLRLKEGQAHVIRNGGGRIRDATRSLVCSQSLLQTNKVMIIHHTDCGFTYFKSNSEVLAALKMKEGTKPPAGADVSVLGAALERLGLKSSSSSEKSQMEPDFMPIHDLEASVREDLAAYKSQPMFDQTAEVRGFIYETETGLLKEIV